MHYSQSSNTGRVQEGIKLVSGSTVNVAPGTYNESIIINKSLTLQSTAGAATTILDGNSFTENYYMVSIEADNVTVNGFTITNPIYNSTADASGIVTANAGPKSSLRVTNCVIHDIGSPTRNTNGNGTYGINCGPVNGAEFDHNTIYNIKNGDASAYAIGIFTWGNSSIETANGINIHDNVVYDIANPSDFNDGINLGGDTENGVVNKNTVTGPFNRAAIVTGSGMDGSAIISNNTVTGTNLYGILLRSPYALTVTGNSITGSAIGIQVNATSPTPEIHLNSISGNTTFGLNNLSDNVANATYNWWGNASGPGPVGPGTGDKVSANVNFDPWLAGPVFTEVGTPNLVVLEELVNLLSTVTDKQDRQKLSDAIDHIIKSLDPDLWIDPLNPKTGDKAFNEMKDAVNKLNDLFKDKKSTLYHSQPLMDLINSLVGAAKSYAQEAITEAAALGDSKEIDKANDEVAKGDKEFAKGKYDDAIEHYRNAWKHAQQAIKKLAKSGAEEGSVTEASNIPDQFGLDQNYPNPFNPTTTIHFALPSNEFVTLKVYDLLGKEVADLVNTAMPAGYHQVNWDASNMPTGIYIYRIQAGSYQSVKKMILMK